MGSSEGKCFCVSYTLGRLRSGKVPSEKLERNRHLFLYNDISFNSRRKGEHLLWI